MSCPILRGVKVADFSWIGVGPVTIKYLADHGATVVHIESQTRPDGLRLGPPFRDQEPGINRSAFFANFNSSKKGVSINLNHPKGPEVARRVIAWADVVAESYTAGTMGRWGLDYESVRRWKPEIIYYSTCQMGQTGPWASQPGFGVQMAALTGFYHLTSWPDRAPAGPYGAYTDFINPRFGAVAILAALEHRDRTGVGQHVDLSQLEGGLQFMGPMVMEYLNNGHDPEPCGNQDPQACPHGAYPCRGEERWIAIAVFTDAQWEALCRVAQSHTGNDAEDAAWSSDHRFRTFQGRKAQEKNLEEAMSRWTRSFDAHELMTLLQAEGVPAGVVQTCEELYKDPQLAHRGAFVELEHLEIGRHRYDGVPFHLSRTPGGPHQAAPCLGQDNEEVFKGVLGMSDEEYNTLQADGVFE